MAASTIKIVRYKFYWLMSCCQMEFDIEKMFLEVTFIGRGVKENFCRMKPLLIRRKALSTSIRPVLSSNHYCRAANYNGTTVSSVVAYACGWHKAYHHGC